MPFSNRPKSLSLGKNIGIAQPRPQPPRPNLIKSIKSHYLYPDSVMNNKSNTGEFGTPSGGNRKLNVYNKNEVVKKDLVNLSNTQKKHGALTTGQARMEARVGQMDRLARIKAAAIKNSKK